MQVSSSYLRIDMLSVSDLTTIFFFLLSPRLELLATYIIHTCHVQWTLLELLSCIGEASYTYTLSCIPDVLQGVFVPVGFQMSRFGWNNGVLWFFSNCRTNSEIYVLGLESCSGVRLMFSRHSGLISWINMRRSYLDFFGQYSLIFGLIM